MKVYAETASRRARQLVADLLVGAWVAASVLAGLAVRRLVDELARPGQAVQQAGDRVANGMGGVQDQVSRIPAIGGGLRAPFERLGEATAASRLRRDLSGGDLGLFALRAIANRPLRELRRASPDPVADLQRGDYGALAALELRALGLRPARPSR